jgi:hypothetical protein
MDTDYVARVVAHRASEIADAIVPIEILELVLAIVALAARVAVLGEAVEQSQLAGGDRRAA